MKHHTKLNSEQRQEHAAEQHQTQQPAREFATPEELLRYDAAQTTMPPGIAQKLQRSVDGLPKPDPKPAWWKRLLGGNS